MALLPRIKQMNSRFNGLLGRLVPRNDFGGLLSPEEADETQRQGLMTIGTSLLQSSGPSLQPISFGQALGGAFERSQAAQSGAVDSALSRRLLEAQLLNLTAPQGRDDRTPNDILMLDALGLPRTPEGMSQLAKVRGPQGTTINIGDKQNEPIPIGQLSDVRLPDGSTPPIGTTFAEARTMGARVQSSAEQQRTTQSDAALGILGELEELALGPEGVFSNVEPGFVNRAAAAVTHALDMVTQENPEASRYHDLSRSALSPFIKMLGEAGALAEGDVQRALGLLPRSFPLPDTEEVAREKLTALREIITRGVRKYNAGQQAQQEVPSELPPLPPGFTLDQP